MSNIITGSQSLDPILTGLFYQSVQAASDYKGLTAAPPKAIDGYTGQYLALSSRPRLSLDQTDDAFASGQLNALGLNDTSLPTGISFETKTVTLDRYARNVFVNARDVAQYQAGSGFDLRQPALSRRLTRSRTRSWACTLTRCSRVSTARPAATATARARALVRTSWTVPISTPRRTTSWIRSSRAARRSTTRKGATPTSRL
jgi:hypothetical protein